MPFALMEYAIQPIVTKMDKVSFSDLLYELRETLGIKLYKVAEYCGCSYYAMRRLESGNFHEMPDEFVLTTISKLYGIDENKLIQKAKDQVKNNPKKRKVDVRKFYEEARKPKAMS